LSESTQTAPKSWLNTYTKKYPRAWALAESAWLDLRDKWSKWCFLPIGGWYAIESKYRDNSLSSDAGLLAALGTWRLTQGIYKFDQTLLDALKRTELKGNIPQDALLRLPQWCIYVDLNENGDDEDTIVGFFAFLEDDREQNTQELRLILDYKTELLVTTPIYLGNWSIEEGIKKATKRTQEVLKQRGFGQFEVKDAAAKMPTVIRTLSPLVAILLYLCSDQPDIADHDPTTCPYYPAPKKTKKGLRLFAPDAPRIYRVGDGIGERIRQALKHDEEAARSGSKRPHIRRAHWHGYWRGKRNGERAYSYTWLFPIAVNVAD
jgi:hypothetical protein